MPLFVDNMPLHRRSKNSARKLVEMISKFRMCQDTEPTCKIVIHINSKQTDKETMDTLPNTISPKKIK